MISRFLLRLNQIAHANGATVTYGKDPDDMPRPASITTTGAATSWATGTYAYDGAGNVKKIGTVSPYESFIYDTVSRLTSGTIVTGGVNRTQTASFDAFGFMTTLTTNGGSQTFTPVSGTNHISGPGYDAGGAMTTWGTYTYEWDRLGQMAAVAGSITRRTFLYTAGGERIEERVGADALNPTSCVLAVRGLDGKVLRLYTKTSGTWSWSEDYVYRNGAALASVTSAGTKHLHLDHLGSIRRITGTGTPAAVVATHDYYPFGMEATDPCQDAERMEYHGLERDQQGTCSVQTEDLDYAHARFSSPILARFMSLDPVRGDPRHPQSFNLFAFVQNNPITFTDPLGLAPQGFHLVLSDTITVTAADPCPDVPRGFGCTQWRGIMGGLDRFFIDSHAGRDVHTGRDAGPVEDPMLTILRLVGSNANTTEWLAQLTSYLALGFMGPADAALNPYLFSGGGPVSLWPAAGAGASSVVIHGREYIPHALQRMAPASFGGRGVPPSAVENAVRLGVQSAGNSPGRVLHVFENVVVVTEDGGNRVVSVIRTGH